MIPFPKKWFSRSSGLRLPPSVRFEVSVIYTVVLGIVLAVFSGVFYWILSQTIFAERDRELSYKAKEIANTLHTYLEVKGEDPEALFFAVEKTVAKEGTLQKRWWHTGFERSWFSHIDRQDLSKYFINFATPSGDSLVASDNMTTNLRTAFQTALDSNPDKEFFRYAGHGETRFRVINFPFIDHKGRKFWLQVGLLQRPYVLLLQRWMNLVLLSIPIILLLTGWFGGAVAGRILKPIDQIIRAARTISYEDLNARVERDAYYREMASLVAVFNDMIARLQKSFQHIEVFSSHVAHELKTPLTILQGETEVALMKERTPKEYRAVLENNLDEIGHMLRIIEDLLFLARVDFEPDFLKFKEIDFRDFIEDLYQQYEKMAQEKNIHLLLRMPRRFQCVVRADPVHLRRLFFNILDNAVKFTPKGGYVRLFVRKEGTLVEVSISDTGIGISPENLEKIFRHLYRVDSAQSGSGLGLNIARSIARVHGGDIAVTSTPRQGSTFTITLPLARLS